MELPLAKLRGMREDIDKYMWLRQLNASDTTLFHRLLLTQTEEILPFIYTPTVGEACQRYHELPIESWGLFIRSTDRGQILHKLQAWHGKDIRVIVVTDGERILGLGDLGAGGMGISEGKCQLYTAAGGVHPDQMMAVCLDVGTNNKALLSDSLYKGLRQPRLSGAEYDSFVQEFMEAVQKWRPHVLVQFEDFGNTNAFRILERYRDRACCFNDDIQGTACIALAGILAALRLTGKSLLEQRILFFGAGEAGTGIGELVAIALQRRHGLTIQQGRERCIFLDSKGLVCAARLKELQHHKLPFAHDLPFQPDLLSAVLALQPTALIGVSTVAKAFTPEILQAMSSLNPRPIIFPLSNPTSKSECTFREALSATGGTVIFASGSPYPAIPLGGVLRLPTQANNAYIFPAIGHAALLTKCSAVTDDVFLLAGETLSQLATVEEQAQGLLFPRFSGIKSTSAVLIAEIAEHMCASGLGSEPEEYQSFAAQLAARGGPPPGVSIWEAFVRTKMFRVPDLPLSKL